MKFLLQKLRFCTPHLYVSKLTLQSSVLSRFR